DFALSALSINNVGVTEGNSGTTTATFTVTLTPTSTQTVTVAYATADGTATISDAQGVGTILNNDIPPPTVTVSPATVNPGDMITATMANGPGNTTDW